MGTFSFDHIHLRSSNPEATANFFETMFEAEVTRSVYPPGTLYPGQLRIMIRAGGQKILVAPKHPHDPMTPAPPFPYYGLEHCGFTVEDLDATIATLRAKGAEIAVGPVTRDAGTPGRRDVSGVRARAGWDHGGVGREEADLIHAFDHSSLDTLAGRVWKDAEN